jgi:hypothetical protein
MIRKVLDRVAAAIDPRGPLGEILSPSDVFKERAGLPTTNQHDVRDTDFRPAESVVLAAPKVVSAGEIVVPFSRMRLVSRYVEEHYAPVLDTPRFSGLTESIRALNTIVEWKVTQKLRSPHCDCAQATLELDAGKLVHKACGRARAHRSDEDFIQHIQSLQIAPSDEFYNTDYPTIPGKDVYIMPDGKPLRGTPTYDANGKMTHDGIIRQNTRMTGGRREWKQKTKNMVMWDKGVVKERDKAYAAHQKSFIDGVRPKMEKVDKQMMPRKLGEL